MAVAVRLLYVPSSTIRDAPVFSVKSTTKEVAPTDVPDFTLNAPFKVALIMALPVIPLFWLWLFVVKLCSLASISNVVVVGGE